jgi:2-oxoglutarate dehydrogenase E1 component
MTPKSILRHPDAKSGKEEFLSGKFYEVIDDIFVSDKKKVKKVILVSGKLYYELDAFKNKNNIKDSAIIRIEQYYPYPVKQIKKIFKSYINVKEVLWVQEEPKNMGAWSFLSQRLLNEIPDGCKLRYIGRPESASPAAGSSRTSSQQQIKIVQEVFS